MEKEYFKLKWVESGHYSSMSELNSSKAKFIDYIWDEAGTPIGIEVEYDGGPPQGSCVLETAGDLKRLLGTASQIQSSWPPAGISS